MCTGIALLWSEIPLAHAGRERLREHLHERGGEREVRFLYRQAVPLLPVWYEGTLQFLPWGNRRRRGRLPYTGWTWQTTVEAGGWAAWSPQPADIPATFGLENGVWFRIRQGIRGLVVRDDDDRPCVYMICERATRYYQVMTRSERMPLLIGEWI